MMKASGFIAIGLLASYPLSGMSQENHNEPLLLTASQMDGVTAGNEATPVPAVAVGAAANAVGTVAITGTSSGALVLNGEAPTQFGFGANYVTASGALASATGDQSRSTSYASSDDSTNSNPFATTIAWTFGVGPTQISAFSSVQPSGVLVYNLLQRLNNF